MATHEHWRDEYDEEVTFGKHQGKWFSEVPDRYKQWMLEQIAEDRDGGVEYVVKLRAAGVTLTHVMARSSHSFSLLVDAKAKAQSVEAWKAAFLK